MLGMLAGNSDIRQMRAVMGVCACVYVCVRACGHAAGRSSKASKPCHSKAWTAAGSCECASAACFQRHLLATRGKWRGAAGRHAGPGPCSALRSAVGAPALHVAPHFLTHTIRAVPRICKQLLVFSSSETRNKATGPHWPPSAVRRTLEAKIAPLPAVWILLMDVYPSASLIYQTRRAVALSLYLQDPWTAVHRRGDAQSSRLPMCGHQHSHIDITHVVTT